MTPEQFDLMEITCKEIFRGNIDGKLWVITQHDSLGALKSWYWDEEKWEYICDESVQILKGFDSFIFKMIKLAKSHIDCPKEKRDKLVYLGGSISEINWSDFEELDGTPLLNFMEGRRCPQKD